MAGISGCRKGDSVVLSRGSLNREGRSVQQARGLNRLTVQLFTVGRRTG